MENQQSFNDTFEFDPSKKYHLSIQISGKNLTYIILDIDEKKYVYFQSIDIVRVPEKSYELQVEEILNGSELLTDNYFSVYVQFLSFRAMLVPESLFDSKNLGAFLKFHHDVGEKDHIHYLESKPAEAFVIFSVPSELENTLKRKFKNLKMVHHSIPFINSAFSFDPNEKNKSVLFLNISDNFFDILIVKNRKIQLFNSFFYTKYTDLIYYIANIINLFSLKPNTTELHILGDIEPDSELDKELSNIFKHISFEKFNLDYNYSEEFAAQQQHKFINLLNLYHCVL